MTILKEAHVPKTDDSFKYNYMFDGCNYTFPALESKLIGLIINGNLKFHKNIINYILCIIHYINITFYQYFINISSKPMK